VGVGVDRGSRRFSLGLQVQQKNPETVKKGPERPEKNRDQNLKTEARNPKP